MSNSKYSHDQIERIFSAAKTLESESDRQDYLEGACSGDEALRAEVEELLQVQQSADSFLDRPALDDLPDTTTEALADVSALGQSIGKYRLLQKLGEGGMGTVFMAEQTTPIHRRVAIKVIKTGSDSKQFAARFEAERQALAMMDHPNIAKVLDAGCTDRGQPYFVMELVKGVPITQYCDQNKLTTQERLKLFLPVCQAVQHAHQKGVIHRDLKPSNVMVALYDDRPVPKVIDFGVAKATNQRLTEKTLFTMVGQIVGTWEYMSPEQAVLNQLDVDTRSDVYSLGVLLYELLVGVPPIDSKRLREAGLEETLRMIREEEPLKPSTRLSSLGQAATAAAGYRRTEKDLLIRSVRGDLDWVVMKAIEKDRTRRYQTPLELADDIQNHMSDEPVNARAPTAWYRCQKYARRHRGFVASIASVFLALMIGLLFALTARNEAILKQQDAIVQKQIAVAAQQQLQEQNKRLDDVVASLRESRAERILEFALTGDTIQADQEYQILKSTFPPESKDTHLMLCESIIDLFKGNADRTAAREKLLKMGTDDLAVHSLLVASHYYAGIEWEYWTEVGALMEREPVSFDEFLFRGFAFTWGVPDQAIKDLEEAKKRKPASAIARVLLSNAYYRKAQHEINREAALEHAEQSISDGRLAKQILFQDSPFAAAQLIGACAKQLSLSRLLDRPEIQITQCQDALQDAIQEAEDMPYDPQLHFALLTARRVLQPDTFGDHPNLYSDYAQTNVPAHETVVVNVETLQYYYFHQNLDECRRILEKSKADMVHSMSLVLLPEAEARYPSESIESITNDTIGQLSNPDRHELTGMHDWALLKLLGAEQAAEKRASHFRDFLVQKSQQLDVANEILPIARYMSGDQSTAPNELLKHASTNRSVSAIAFLLGVDRLAAGDRSEAKRYFEMVVEADFFELYDYAWSRAFLTRIDDPAWLPWLPNDHSLEEHTERGKVDE